MNEKSAKKILSRSLLRGMAWGSGALGVPVTIFTIDEFVESFELSLPDVAMIVLFLILPVVAFVFGAFSSLLKDAVESGSNDQSMIELWRNSTQLVAKIHRIKWGKLSSDEKSFFYSQYLRLAPQAYVQDMVVASRERQLALQKRQPIDIGPLRTLMDLFEVPEFEASIPMSRAEFGLFSRRRQLLVDAIAENAACPLPENQAAAFREVYEYLSCGREVPNEELVRRVDVLVIPGARWSLQQRVDHALLQQKLSGASLILTGGAPYYAGDDAPPITEAEAMSYYLSEKQHVNLVSEKIYLENRSRSSIEGLIHAQRPINSIVMALGIPVTLGLVSSSYHMRRYFLQAQEVFINDEHLVKKIVCLVVPATLDIDAILDGREVDPRKRKVLLRTFISEYLKLIGGRVIGEF